ncbi:hypothetical protein H0H93_006050 [Arthromyces matolae]|nr:hypothetical protein H0H93_006050 [Arthromyces matolae]
MKPTLVLVPAFAAFLSALLVCATPIPTSDALVARAGSNVPPASSNSAVTSGTSDGSGSEVGVAKTTTHADPDTGDGSDTRHHQPADGQLRAITEHNPHNVRSLQFAIRGLLTRLTNARKAPGDNKGLIAELNMQLKEKQALLAELQGEHAQSGDTPSTQTVAAASNAGSTKASGSSG